MCAKFSERYMFQGRRAFPHELYPSVLGDRRLMSGCSHQVTLAISPSKIHSICGSSTGLPWAESLTKMGHWRKMFLGEWNSVFFFTFNYVESCRLSHEANDHFDLVESAFSRDLWCECATGHPGKSRGACPFLPWEQSSQILLLHLCKSPSLWPWVDTPSCPNLLYACPLLVNLPGLGNFGYLNLSGRQLLKARKRVDM